MPWPSVPVSPEWCRTSRCVGQTGRVSGNVRRLAGCYTSWYRRGMLPCQTDHCWGCSSLLWIHHLPLNNHHSSNDLHAGQCPTLVHPTVSLTSCLCPAAIISLWTKPTKIERSKNNFRWIIYGHSSTNPENLAKIGLVEKNQNHSTKSPIRNLCCRLCSNRNLHPNHDCELPITSTQSHTFPLSLSQFSQ